MDHANSEAAWKNGTCEVWELPQAALEGVRWSAGRSWPSALPTAILSSPEQDLLLLAGIEGDQCRVLSRIDGRVVGDVSFPHSEVEHLQVCPGLGPCILECDMTHISLTITSSAYARMRDAVGNVSFEPLRGTCSEALFYKSSPVPNQRNVDLRILHFDSADNDERRPSIAMFYADGGAGGSWPLRFGKQAAGSNAKDGEPNGEDDAHDNDQEDDEEWPEYLGTGHFMVSR